MDVLFCEHVADLVPVFCSQPLLTTSEIWITVLLGVSVLFNNKCDECWHFNFVRMADIPM